MHDSALVRTCTAILVALCLAGCSSPAPDVVATKPAVVRDGGDSYFDLPLVDGCKPGHYAGSFVSIVPDSGASFAFVGNIDFALVEARSGEFLTLSNDATLSGSTDTGATFTAELKGELDGGSSGCHEGSVSASMTNGEYHLVAPDPASPSCVPNGCFQFTGPISGQYSAQQRGFLGEWTAHIGPTLTVQGNWYAIWTPKR